MLKILDYKNRSMSNWTTSFVLLKLKNGGHLICHEINLSIVNEYVASNFDKFDFEN